MSSETYRLLANTIRIRYPTFPVHCRSERPTDRNSVPLDWAATFFEYIVVDGKRYHASLTVMSNSSSFVHVVIPAPSPVDAYGEVLEIFQFNQDFRRVGRPMWLARLRWFKPWNGQREKLWDDL
jgi:hypothetical protein